MIKNIFCFSLCIILFSNYTLCQKINANKKSNFTYNYFVDLTELHNDRLTVTLNLDKLISKDSILFCFPKMVPGIYGTMNFGKNISDFSAYDKENKTLQVNRLDTNQWLIKNPQALKKIIYEVNDGWEEFDTANITFYRSAESSFDKSCFTINNNSLFGYFENYRNVPFKIQFKKPAAFFGSTSLYKKASMQNVDYYEAESYAKLVDNPILYCVPDTTYIDLDGVKVCVAAFSSSNKKISDQLATYIKPLLQKQKVFLGGKLPISTYTFLIYHNISANSNIFLADGLEHSRSTLILLYYPLSIDDIKETVYSIASHEFFHCITPLALHAEEIQNYNFSNPQMSKHLWLYEGMTEYFTKLLAIKSNTISIKEFLKIIKEKIIDMKKFDNTLSMTLLSKQAIQRQDQYYNFYLRGMLFNLCLDIKLREYTHGKMGAQELIQALLKKYNEHKPFKDDQLFNDIAEISRDRTIKPFLIHYIKEGNEPPLYEYLQKVGIDYNNTDNMLQLSDHPSVQQLQLRKQWINY